MNREEGEEELYKDRERGRDINKYRRICTKDRQTERANTEREV